MGGRGICEWELREGVRLVKLGMEREVMSEVTGWVW